MSPANDDQTAETEDGSAMGNVEPESIGDIEPQGTGTPLGDPIEIAALNRAFQQDSDPQQSTQQQSCAIGSLKTNVGHLDAAAGVTGLIKASLSLNHQLLPPSLNFESPNPKAGLGNSPFYVNTDLKDWPQTEHQPRRAGVSSFGIGGTNAHVILEEAPQRSPSGPSRPWQPLLLSARTASALDTATANLVDHLHQQSTLNLADVAYTLSCGRQEFAHRIHTGKQKHPRRHQRNPAQAVGALGRWGRFQRRDRGKGDGRIPEMVPGDVNGGVCRRLCILGPPSYIAIASRLVERSRRFQSFGFSPVLRILTNRLR